LESSKEEPFLSNRLEMSGSKTAMSPNTNPTTPVDHNKDHESIVEEIFEVDTLDTPARYLVGIFLRSVFSFGYSSVVWPLVIFSERWKMRIQNMFQSTV
jgi:hypothetical protein